MKAVRFSRYGEPDVLEVVDVPRPEAAEGQVLIQVHAVGVNYADIARRRGMYVSRTPLPFIPGSEVAGVVAEVGLGVTRFRPGDRVTALTGGGGYAEFAVAAEGATFPVPEDMPLEQAVCIPLQGLTAYHVLKTSGRLEPGESVLVQAAAGGVGLLALQLARIFGAGRVIGCAGSPDKRRLAADFGADPVVDYTDAGWAERVLEQTGGHGVDVVLEMVGGSVFEQSLRVLAPFGRLVVYGAASHQVSQLIPQLLMRRCHTVAGFYLSELLRHPHRAGRSMEELMDHVRNGRLRLHVGGTFPLDEAARVHELMEGRRTTGKLVLLP